MNVSNCNALLVVGHGTRCQQGLTEYWDLLAKIDQTLPNTTVAGCFLELAEPGIDTAMKRLAATGVQRIVVMPLMLFEAGHAKRDIPLAARQAAQRHGLQIQFANALENHEALVKLSARRFREATAPHGIAPEDVFWVFVGRGNRDSTAIDRFGEFMADRLRISPVGESRCAFLAMATPRIETVTEEVNNSPLKWVVVQPHLLLHGELLQRLQRMVDEQDRLGERQQWLITEHLGSSELVAAAVSDRFCEALNLSEVR